MVRSAPFMIRLSKPRANAIAGIDLSSSWILRGWWVRQRWPAPFAVPSRVRRTKSDSFTSIPIPHSDWWKSDIFRECRSERLFDR
jgi:hypothetical protein